MLATASTRIVAPTTKAMRARRCRWVGVAARRTSRISCIPRCRSVAGSHRRLMIGAHRENFMRERLTYGRGLRLIAALFLAILVVATVVAIARRVPVVARGQPPALTGAGLSRSSPGSRSSGRAGDPGSARDASGVRGPSVPVLRAVYAATRSPACSVTGCARGRLRLDLRLLSFIGPDSQARPPRWPAPRLSRIDSGSSQSCSSRSQGTENSGYVTPGVPRGDRDRRHPVLNVQLARWDYSRTPTPVTAQLPSRATGALDQLLRVVDAVVLPPATRTCARTAPPVLTDRRRPSRRRRG